MSVTWAEFVATHASAVLAAAMRVVANSADADEVAQEVFVEVFRSGRFTELGGQVAGLLRTMATRRAIDCLRRRKSTIALEATDIEARTRRPGGFEPHEHLVAAELELRLRQALTTLPPREAEVFCLVYFEDLSQPQIAQMLEISPGAVAKALSMARQRLSAAFERAEHLGMETNR